MTSHFRHSVVILFFLLFVMVSAQLKFIESLGGDGDEYGYSIVYDNGFVICGVTNSFGIDTLDAFVVKLTAGGGILWAKAYGGESIDWGYSVINVSGGYVFAGATGSFGEGDFDILVVKLSSSGDVIWAKTLGFRRTDVANDVIKTVDGGYLLVGKTNSFGSFTPLIIKLDSLGNVDWAVIIPDTFYYSGSASSAINTIDSSLLVTGKIYISSEPYMLLAKLSLAGRVLWAKASCEEAKIVSANKIIRTMDGGFAVAGWHFVNYYSFPKPISYIAKFNPAGELVWFSSIEKSTLEWGNSVIQANDSGLAVVGFRYTSGERDFAVFISKLSPSGEFLWYKTIPTLGNSKAHDIASYLGLFYGIAGEVEYPDTDNYDIMFIRCDQTISTCLETLVASGATMFHSEGAYTTSMRTIDLPSTTIPVTPAVHDISTSISVTNVTPRVTEICAADVTESDILTAGEEISVYPNPFNSSCTITVPFNACVNIYDLRGNLIFKSNNSTTHNPADDSIKRVVWHPGNSVSSGVYIIAIKTNTGKTLYGKIILIK